MTLAEIYAQIPDVHCKGKCHGACGPIAMAPAESAAIKEIVGEKLQTEHVEGVGLFVKNFTSSGKCPLLSAGGRCEAYAARPVICRIWAATKALRCPFGCRPKRWLSRQECHALLDAANSVAPLNKTAYASPADRE